MAKGAGPADGNGDTARPRVVAIFGATATGKTALAIHLARGFDGEIVNADSRLFYRGVDIGTAKPSADEKAAVPHHLVDFLEPADRFGLAEFIDRAAALIRGVSNSGRLAVLAGGTGQYVRGLLEGWEVPRVPPDMALRAELESLAEEQGPGAVLARLRALDPEAAERIDPRNVRRMIRAVEVASAPGSPAPGRAAEPPFDSLVLGLAMPREQLYARIDARIDAMLLAGWPGEVRDLLAAGVPLSAPAMSSIGYRELAAYLAGEITLDEAVTQTRRATRALVRHQANWFRRSDPGITWLDATDEKQARESASEAVEAWLRERPEHADQT